MDDLSRIYLRSAMLHSAYNRRSRGSDSEVALPTLAHVPGVDICGSYTTAPVRLRCRQAVMAPHASLKKPREIFGPARHARLVHLGNGKVMSG